MCCKGFFFLGGGGVFRHEEYDVMFIAKVG